MSAAALTLQSYRTRGEFYRRKGRHAEALRMFDAALERAPGDGWLLARRAATSVALKAAAQRLSASHSLDRRLLSLRYGVEIASLEQVLERCPSDVWARCQLIDALRCAQRLPECITQCDELLAQRPQLAWALRRRAWGHRHSFRVEAALQDTERSLELQPDASTRAYRALLLGLLGKLQECDAQLEELLHVAPALVSSFSLERALFLIAAGQYTQALPWLRRRQPRGDDYLRLDLLVVALSYRQGSRAAQLPLAAARARASRLLATEARGLGEYLLAALAVLEGNTSASALAELQRCVLLDVTLVE